MCARKLKYAAGDDLLLYATPKEAMQNTKRNEEDKKPRVRKPNVRTHSEPGMGQPMPTGRSSGDYVHGASYVPKHQSLSQPQLQQMPIPNAYSSSKTRPRPQQMIGNPVQNMRGNNYGGQGRIVSSPPAMVPPSAAMQRAQAQVSHTPPRIANKSPEVAQNAMLSRTKGALRDSSQTLSEEDAKDTRIAIQLFHNHDVRGKERLTAEELQNLLQNDDNTHFCISAVDALINLFGATRFGTVNESEFISLYKRVKKWRKIYVDNDINGSYTITMSEFHNSLQELGYMVPVEVSEKLFDQYAEFNDPANNAKELKFDKFVEALVWLMRLTKLFRKFDKNQDGVAHIQYKEFIDVTLYLGRFLPH